MSFFSIFRLIRVIPSIIPKISLPACLILDISMKKTIKLGFGRRPYNIFIFSLSIFLLVRLKASCMLKISFLGALEVGFGEGDYHHYHYCSRGKQSQPSLPLDGSG